MRKIEQAMNRAILARKNWASGNTTVSYEEGNRVSTVRLHGHKIAEIGDNYIKVSDAGWQTVTTKSRLNAILAEHGTGERIFQKNHQWFIRMNDGLNVPFDGSATLY
jgi:hypothetical protein